MDVAAGLALRSAGLPRRRPGPHGLLADPDLDRLEVARDTARAAVRQHLHDTTMNRNKLTRFPMTSS